VTKRREKYFVRAVFNENASGLALPGRDGRATGHVPAYHRERTEYSPFCVPNELICATIGRFLGLPIPPFAITHFDGRTYFSSLNFNSNDTGDEPPPVNPAVCAQKLPWLCTGIVFFDILVANPDRHEKNLAVDDVDNPSQLLVYDHDQALFGGGGDPFGIARLNTLWERSGITGGVVTGGVECCLLQSIATVDYFDEWRDRVEDIPDWFVQDVCTEAIKVGIDKRQAQRASEFLVHRKRTIRELVQSCKYVAPLTDTWRPARVLFR
jgi:hypothetical protein